MRRRSAPGELITAVEERNSTGGLQRAATVCPQLLLPKTALRNHLETYYHIPWRFLFRFRFVNRKTLVGSNGDFLEAIMRDDVLCNGYKILYTGTTK